jgi:hypothetical protein
MAYLSAEGVGMYGAFLPSVYSISAKAHLLQMESCISSAELSHELDYSAAALSIT